MCVLYVLCTVCSVLCVLYVCVQEMQGISNVEDTEAFMLRHGENIIDSLGGEVDRIEKNLKVVSL